MLQQRILRIQTECSNNMVNIIKNIEDYNPNKKRKILIVSYDVITDMLSNEKINPIVTELFPTRQQDVVATS